MVFLEIIEGLFLILVATFLVTQVIWPILTERPICSMFRRRRRAIDAAMTEAHEEADEARARREIDAVKTSIRGPKRKGDGT